MAAFRIMHAHAYAPFCSGAGSLVHAPCTLPCSLLLIVQLPNATVYSVDCRWCLCFLFVFVLCRSSGCVKTEIITSISHRLDELLFKNNQTLIARLVNRLHLTSLYPPASAQVSGHELSSLCPFLCSQHLGGQRYRYSVFYSKRHYHDHHKPMVIRHFRWSNE